MEVLPSTRIPSTPHPGTIFSLVPTSEDAQTIINHPANRHLVSFVTHNTWRGPGLNIGPHIRSQSRSRLILATIGRNGADITIQAPKVSRLQCTFEVNETTGAILLWDRSSMQRTQFHGDKAVPFELGRSPRRMVIHPEGNLYFGFGRAEHGLFKFRIVWHSHQDSNIQSLLMHRVEHPSNARTEEEQRSGGPGGRPTRMLTAIASASRIRWQKKAFLGKGGFGEVISAVNMDTGDDIAVKLLEIKQENVASLKREAQVLNRLSHPNILEFIGAQYSDNPDYFEIITELRAGSVRGLIGDGVFVNNPRVADSLLRDLLQAVDYLESQGLIHRDIKPDNILYTQSQDGTYKFQLADFGLCKSIAEARSSAGTTRYKAPELDSAPGSPQSSKIDVWSIFITLADVMNISDFRSKHINTPQEKAEAVGDAVRNSYFKNIREMVLVDPALRASASQMLHKLYGGHGRTT